tara:strand:- start:2479 stop:2997 length:519 start_codon:yes stop_codon:yes gene_type:complete
MSGAHALASARRRRAAPGNSKSSSSSSNQLPPPVSTRSNGGTASASPPAAPPQKINPGAMLLNHDKVLQNLTEVCTNLNATVEQQEETINEKLNSLTLDDTNIEYFRDKVKSMEKQLNDIKKHIVKVQTFAMETNLQCMELKKAMQKEEGASSESQLQSASEISETLNSEVI